MNSSRCSRWTVLLVATALAVGFVAPTAALTVGDEQVSEEGEVGSNYEASFTLEELYQNPDLDSWILEGETELTNVTWTVEFYDQTGAKVDQLTVDGQYLNQSAVSDQGGNPDQLVVTADFDIAEVQIRLSGTVPPVEEYTIDETEQFLVADLTQTRSGGSSNDIGNWSAHHYTADSREARQAIEDARSAIDEAEAAGADTSEAEDFLDSAESAYDGGNFENAIDTAGKAETSADEARDAAESTQQRNQLLMYGGIGVVALLAVGGVFFWYRSQQDEYGKL